MSGSVTIPNRQDGDPLKGQWRVRDQNARVVVAGQVVGRDHEILPGISYTLFFDRDTLMPEEHARRFLVDEAFIVRAPDNTRLAPFSEQVKSRDLPPVLKPNQVIADLNELNQESLLNRALLKPGAPKFNIRSKRDAIIEFLISAHEAEGPGARAAPAAEDDDGDVEELDPDAVDKMFEG
jgi:hypothetical protein